jgi:hypothetical protein
MPPRWNEYRKVIARNGFEKARSRKHETWIKYDADRNVVGQTRASHGNAEIADKSFFKALLRQCGKTEAHFYDVLAGKAKPKPGTDD